MSLSKWWVRVCVCVIEWRRKVVAKNASVLTDEEEETKIEKKKRKADMRLEAIAVRRWVWAVRLCCPLLSTRNCLCVCVCAFIDTLPHGEPRFAQLVCISCWPACGQMTDSVKSAHWRRREVKLYWVEANWANIIDVLIVILMVLVSVARAIRSTDREDDSGQENSEV